jgi:carbon storage regulator
VLVLTRKVYEEIEIGPDIVVSVLRVKNGEVRLGIQAPAEVKIWRPEARRVREDEPSS